MRDIPANIVYFGIYEIVKQGLTGKASLTVTALSAGAAAGVAFWPVALPFDCIKTRYQTAEAGTYKNIGDVFNEVLNEVLESCLIAAKIHKSNSSTVMLKFQCWPQGLIIGVFVQSSRC